MKLTLFLSILVFSSTVSAKQFKLRRFDEIEKRLNALERRVAALESKQKVSKNNGLTVKAVGKQVKKTSSTRGLARTANKIKTPVEKQKELRNTSKK